MAKAADSVIGKTKEVIAEVIGDGKLQREGEQQRKKPDRPEPLETPKSLPE
jgi:uncharacterized protein YjbJ (UPF0337 family)